MSASSETVISGKPPSVSSARSADYVEKLALAERDAAIALPVLLLFASAIIWLVGWSVLNFILAIKLVSPGFLGDGSFFTYGRLQPVATNIFTYGWASCAGMGTALWVMARLCRVRVGTPFSVLIGTAFWNTGLLIGIIATQAGAGRALKYLELPVWSQLIMFLGFALIAIYVIGLFVHRPPGPGFISQFYIVAAFLWLGWSLLAANIFASLPWVRGVITAVNGAWFAGNFQGLWFTALGLAAVYYLIPKVTGKAIHSYYLAHLGFWTLAFLYPWTGLHQYNGGPIPAWLMTLSIVATTLTIVPVATVAVNHHVTMVGSHFMMHYSPTLRFTVAGAMCYTASAVTGILLAQRSVSHIAGMSFAGVAQDYFVLYTFFSFVMFGAIYFIMPRLVRREWVSAQLIKFHFWGAAYGIGLTILFLTVAGLFQGSGWNSAVIRPVMVAQMAEAPLRGTILAAFLLLAGHAVFAVHFILMVLRMGQVSSEPTYLASPTASYGYYEEEEQETHGKGAA
ncbi:MAG TPA: cbb3-type cytochrome c oxidase subunit I [Chthoniobacterales bacterium]